MNRNYFLVAPLSGLLFFALQVSSSTIGQVASPMKAASSQATARPLDTRPPRTLVPRQHHEWGRFSAGASRRVRVVTEFFKNDQFLRSTTAERTVILRRVADDEADLEICTTFGDAGTVRVDKGILRVDTLTFNGPVKGRKVQVEQVGSRKVWIGGEEFETEVRRITVGKADKRWESEVCYSATVAPYVLKRKNQAGEVGKAVNTTTVEVVALNMPFPLHRLGEGTPEILTTSHLKTVSQGADGKTVSFEIRSEDVPGGIVLLSRKKLDPSGRIIRRTTVRLLDYSGTEASRFASRPKRAGRRDPGRRRNGGRNRPKR